MPTIPTERMITKTNTSVRVLNAIRNNASVDFRNHVPIATPDADSIRNIGNIIMDYPALQNEFLTSLINRIGKVLVTSKLYNNPLKMFKGGMLELGETVEEIFVNLADAHVYDPITAETEQYKREIPDVKSAFHILNSKTFYKTSTSYNDLKNAFLSWDGVSNLIEKIIESLYTSAEYDEYNVFKYMIARRIYNGQMYMQPINELSSTTYDDAIADIKAKSNDFTFLKTNYNPAGVYNHSSKSDQVILVNAKFDAQVSVEVLAYAFNMDKAEVEAHKVLFDGFSSIDKLRLAQIFAGDEGYSPFSDEELAALDKIPAILVDKEFFKVFDNLIQFETKYNGQNMYWNHWLHKWNTYSTSPFANACAFIEATPTVTSVTVSPDTATLAPGATVTFSANVLTDNFANKAVVWSVGSNDPATIDQDGVLTVNEDATDGATITVTANSVVDVSKNDTATVTVDAS